MATILNRLFGVRAILLHDDPSAYERWHWLKKYVIHGKARTLDAGCGDGFFTLYAATCGHTAVGVSIDQASNTKAYRAAHFLGIPHVSFLTIDLRTMQDTTLQLGSFDNIMCLETIEHILDDKKLIHDLAQLLKPGGRFYLTTPYKHYRHLHGDTLSLTEDGGHVRWGYTHEELTALIQDYGFEVIAQDYIGGVTSQKLTSLLRFISKKINRRFAWTVTLPLRPLRMLDPLLMHFTNYPYHSVGIVAVKK